MSKARDLSNSVTRQAFVPTGVYHPFALSTPPAGWLLCDGRTIGSAASAATARANSDCFDLYVGLWNSTANTELAVTGGRGASAAADWAANKPIALPDMRGRVPAGKDDMGGTGADRLTVTLTGTRASTANGIITGLSSTAGLSVGMRAVGGGIGTGAVINSIDSATQVTLSVNNSATGSGSIRFFLVDGATLGANGGGQVHKLTTPQMPSHTHNTGATISGRNTSTGGGEVIVYSGSTYTGTATGGDQAHPNVQPTLIANYIIKL